MNNFYELKKAVNLYNDDVKAKLTRFRHLTTEQQNKIILQLQKSNKTLTDYLLHIQVIDALRNSESATESKN